MARPSPHTPEDAPRADLTSPEPPRFRGFPTGYRIAARAVSRGRELRPECVLKERERDCEREER